MPLYFELALIPSSLPVASPARARPPGPLVVLAAASVAGAVAWGVVALSAGDAASRALGLSLALGTLFGIVLQRSRFCFFCNMRDLVAHRDPRGVLAILVALAVGVAGYAVVIGAWLPVPQAGRLPPDAHIGPVSFVLALAAFAFGFGMAVSGSCISAHIYRLGEGSPTAPFALLGTLAGFGAGFLTWNSLFLAIISEAPVIWLPHHFGYAGTLALSLGLLAGLAGLVLRVARPQAREPNALAGGVRSAAHAVFIARWPAVLSGTLVGVISAASYLRVGPLGVTAEIGSIARSMADGSGLLPRTLHGLDGFRGCATVVKTTLLSRNGLFVLGMISGSFAAALLAGQFTPRWPRPADIATGLAGGLLMGWGAMTALGCTVGVLLSGIHAGAVSGWVFLATCCAGVLVGLPLRQRLV